MSKRVDVAGEMGKAMNNPYSLATWLGIIYALEECGYQVVKTSETPEFQGLRVNTPDK